MSNRLYVFAVLILFQSGCASVSVPDSNVLVDGSEDATLNDQQDVENPVAMHRDVLQSENEAIRYLLDNAERALEIEDYSRAQALADRALRIERKAARAYLISALVQLGYGDNLKAQDFARQGLLYTNSDTDVGRELLAVVSDNIL